MDLNFKKKDIIFKILGHNIKQIIYENQKLYSNVIVYFYIPHMSLLKRNLLSLSEILPILLLNESYTFGNP